MYDFIQFFSWFYTCIYPQGRSWQLLGDKILMSTGTSCHFSHMLQVSKNLREVWLYTINVHLQGADSPQGTKFWCQQICLVTSFICCKFKKTSLKSDFIQFFFSWLNTCSPSAGEERPQGTKFWCHQKGLITFLICCKFQRNLFEVWFYTIVFMI